MLGYLAYIYHLVRDPGNRHAFANLTSGFTSVSNDYCRSIVQKLKAHLVGDAFPALVREGYFAPSNAAARMEDVYLYLDGAAAKSEERKDEAEARRLLRNLIAVYGSQDMKVLRLRINELDEYLSATQLGITVASLGLGWIGEPAFAHIIEQVVGRPSWMTPHTSQVLSAIRV